MEKNRCRESGCITGCCENITIYDAESVILNTFPEAKEVNAWQLKKAIAGELPNGVYYQYDGRAADEGMAIARIVGICKNKLSNGDCGNYSRCGHASENFKFGSKDCNKIRIENGLTQV